MEIKKMKKQIKNIAEILRFAGFKAKADFQVGNIKIQNLTNEAKSQIEKMYNIEVVAA